MSRKTKGSVVDHENPEWTRADFAKAAKFPAGVRLKDVKPGQLASLVGKRGPQKTPTKIPVSIRLSPEVVEHFKAQGPGWQSKIDAALRRMVKKAS
ncbi:BrnA antitoxin family protein [Bradyrhizobium diazoefficiens]|uniref:BrnA antitoxin family protein n=1 Tax=Bradyrhizobium diazoefficiens TaxID=1355477 RepID=UPI00190C2AA1|nr:BrnA antitoxin family protein [Bradyrhizobium diazoefficiens]QQO11542.1 BrnA antitoxin family protein [Bradyrhizobium diazoefficiens]